MSSKDAFGDRMKSYEATETNRASMPLLPLMIRLDGRGFSKFTQGLSRPYDKRLSKCMVLLTLYLTREAGAKLGYTQSDEITLLLNQNTYEEQLFFGGKFFKLNSVLASMATAYFSRLIKKYLPHEYYLKRPLFDCRSWNVPNLIEAANCFLWREQDATKNSIQMAVREVASSKQLQGKKREAQLQILKDNGINWNKYPKFFKRGTYIQRKPSTTLDLRSSVVRVKNMPEFRKVINKEEFISKGLPPLTDLSLYQF